MKGPEASLVVQRGHGSKTERDTVGVFPPSMHRATLSKW